MYYCRKTLFVIIFTRSTKCIKYGKYDFEKFTKTNITIIQRKPIKYSK